MFDKIAKFVTLFIVPALAVMYVVQIKVSHDLQDRVDALECKVSGQNCGGKK